jgi:hypothetical protein
MASHRLGTELCRRNRSRSAEIEAMPPKSKPPGDGASRRRGTEPHGQPTARRRQRRATEEAEAGGVGGRRGRQRQRRRRQGRAGDEEEAGEGARQQRWTGDGREQPSRGRENEWIRCGWARLGWADLMVLFSIFRSTGTLFSFSCSFLSQAVRRHLASRLSA